MVFGSTALTTGEATLSSGLSGTNPSRKPGLLLSGAAAAALLLLLLLLPPPPPPPPPPVVTAAVEEEEEGGGGVDGEGGALELKRTAVRIREDGGVNAGRN